MSSLFNKLKKLSFFTHHPKEHETITIDNVTEEYAGKEEIWEEWFNNLEYMDGVWKINNNIYIVDGIFYGPNDITILSFTGWSFLGNTKYFADFSNSVVDWGDGTIKSPLKLQHGYKQDKTYTIKIINAPYSSSNCFYSCDFSSIIIPPNVTSLADNCFNTCRELTSITIPSSVTSLGNSCFSDCTSLTSITIPSSVTNIKPYCFSSSGLTNIEFKWTTSDTIIQYSSNWVSFTNVSTFTIPQGTTQLYIDKGYPSGKLQETTV